MTSDRPTTVADRRGVTLRDRLVAADGLALTTAAGGTWFVTGAPARGVGPAQAAALVAGAVVLGLMSARWQQLYQASRSSIRSAELMAIVRVSATLGVSAIVAASLAGRGAALSLGALLATTTAGAMTVARSLFRAWLRARRAHGDFLRPVVVVGANDDARRLVDVLADHQDSGFAVWGVCSPESDARKVGLRAQWAGDAWDAPLHVRRGDVTGAVVIASAFDPPELNRIVREITAAGGHVHLSSGLQGLDSRRIASEPIAHEPLLHIRPTELDPHQAVVKRLVDIVIASAMLVITAPVLAVAVLLIKLTSDGPALFRQVRVGRGNETFRVLKLRTMAHDAEARLAEVASTNVRRGPLFKAASDPRVTPVGRFLRATSIDELPQLWNVLRGEMSLVGPRPALPSEVDEFPESLSKRTNVLPGVTGLWQVEARDNPSFDAYARLDLFYVENWNVTFDLVILIATVESELSRLFSSLFHRRNAPAGTVAAGRPSTAVEAEVIDLLPGAQGLPAPAPSTFVD